MKTVYQVSQKFSTETETEELLTQDFDNYQEAKDYFENIKHEMQQGGDIVTDLVKYVYNDHAIYAIVMSGVSFLLAALLVLKVKDQKDI